MSIFVYISHQDPIHALVACQELMTQNAYPFVPQLNKLVVGRTDEEWIRYYQMWMLKCDVVLATKSQRAHELAFARENKKPIAFSVAEAVAVQLPPFAELGRQFGEACAELLPKDEGWRRDTKEDALHQFGNIVGLGRDPLYIGIEALKAWDRKTHG